MCLRLVAHMLAFIVGFNPSYEAIRFLTVTTSVLTLRILQSVFERVETFKDMD